MSFRNRTWAAAFSLLVFLAGFLAGPGAWFLAGSETWCAADVPSGSSLSANVWERDRIVNFRVEPMGLLFGIYGANLDFSVNHHVDLGPSFQWFGSSASGHLVITRQYGLSGAFYPQWLWSKSGRLFFRPTFAYLPVMTIFGARTFTAPNYSLGGVIGYQWLWAPGLNITFGAGAVYHEAPAGTPTVAAMSTPASEVQPELEWSVGWQF